ncbi:hypothetical protein DCC35_10760 [Mangrovivirga cuniculi]|uniref:Uncharacterized protein n=1 Tax=Mangrovivirga cuniculi TaxID=2715131 RepID=A0A4D7JJP0_9BACT|nr:hypothetical protein DCC35_10760 [Mangrovivirga cuniculi]
MKNALTILLLFIYISPLLNEFINPLIHLTNHSFQGENPFHSHEKNITKHHTHHHDHHKRSHSHDRYYLEILFDKISEIISENKDANTVNQTFHFRFSDHITGSDFSFELLFLIVLKKSSSNYSILYSGLSICPPKPPPIS